MILIFLKKLFAMLGLLHLLCNYSPLSAHALRMTSSDHKNGLLDTFGDPSPERSELDQINLGSTRNLCLHQPSAIRSPLTYRTDQTWYPTTAAVLANPKEFDGKAIFFTGYLNVDKGFNGKSTRPFYRIYASKDDFDCRDNPNFLYVKLNDDFRYADEFKEGCRVEACGYLSARITVAKTSSACNNFSDSDVSSLTHTSLRLTSENRKLYSRLSRCTRPDQREWSIHGTDVILEPYPRRCIAKGDARITVEHQDSWLTADEIIYDCLSLSVIANGHVKLVRNGKESLSDHLTFEIASDQYLITEPDVYLDQPVLLSP